MDTEYKKIKQRQGSRATLEAIKRDQFLAFDTDQDHLIYCPDGVSYFDFYNSGEIEAKFTSAAGLFVARSGSTMTGQLNAPSVSATTVSASFYGPLNGNASTSTSAAQADKLKNSQTFTIAGDVTATGQAFNGTAGVTLTTTLPNITTAGTYTKTVVNAKGQVTSGGALVASDIPALDASKITTGTFDVARIPVLPSQIQITSTGTLSALTSAQTSAIGQGTVVTTTDGFRWVYTGSGSKTVSGSYVQLSDISPDWTTISNRPTAVSYWTNDSGYLTNASSLSWSKVTGTPTTLAGYGITSADSLFASINAGTATKLQTARTIAGVSFDGSANISIPYANLTGLPTLGSLAAKSTITWTSDITGLPTSISNLGNASVHGGLKIGNVTVGGWHGIEFSDPQTTRILINDAAGGNVCGFYDATNGWLMSFNRSKQLVDGWIPWAKLQNVPSTFTPSAHSHAIADVTGLQTALDSKMPTTITSYMGQPVDPNTLTFFQTCHTSNTAANRPFNYASVTNLGSYNSGIIQLAVATYNSDDNSFAFRRKGDGGTWYPWKTIWHSGNLIGDQGTTHTHSQYLTTATASSTYATKATTLAGYGITDAATSGHNHTSINVSNTNETIIANGYATTGNLWINYRGATSAITTYIFGNGLTNGGKASIDALNGVFSGTVTATGAISGGSFSTAGSIAVNGYTITGTKINDWDNASVLRHLHSNITNLNNINQNLSTADSPSWIGASIGKGSTTGNYNILTFNTERSWAFTKTGDGASTGLNLVELSGQKNFNIGYSSDGLNVTSLAFNILTNQTQSSNQINSWGTWTHYGTLSASGIYSGNAFIGTHAAHTGYAEFCHQSMRGSATGYNVLCFSDGTLNLNAPSGKVINFSNNNGASIATFDSTGFKVNGALVTSGLIGQWNTAWSRIASGRLCEDTYTGEDTLDWITRMGRGNHWGRIHGVQSAPSYYNYMLMRESTGTKYCAFGQSSDGNWYVGSAQYNAQINTYYKIWTSADFSSIAVNRINNSDSSHGFSRLYRSDDQSKYYLRHGWTTGQWYGSAWRMTCANDHSDSQSGISTVAINYSDLSLKAYSLVDTGKYKSNVDTGFKDNSYGLWAGSIDSPTGTTPFGTTWTWMQEWGHSDGNWRAQLATPYFSDNLAFRRKNNGTWMPWRYVVSSDASGNVTIGGTFTASNIYGKLSPTPNNVAILQGIYLNRNCAGTVVSIVGGTVHLQQAIDAADNFFCILHVTGATVINETPYQMWYRGTMYGAGTTISTNLNGCMPVYFRQGQFYIG